MTERGIAPSGLVVAAVGFGLTRFTVTAAATDTTASFLFASVIPLVLGLGLSAAGVLLAVGGFDRPFVRTIAAWCLLGTTVMAALVGLTVLGSEAHPDEMVTVGEQSPFSTFLIGGAVGGALTGLYAARNRRYRRRLNAQTNRLVVLNRLLRDRVVNAATAISAHQEILERGYNGNSVAVIGNQAAHVVETVERVNYLAETDDERLGRVDLVESVESGLAAAREAHPDAEFVFDSPDAVAVRASDRLETAVRHLLENAVEYGDSDSPWVEVAVETTQTEAIFRVSDGGVGSAREPAGVAGAWRDRRVRRPDDGVRAERRPVAGRAFRRATPDRGEQRRNDGRTRAQPLCWRAQRRGHHCHDRNGSPFLAGGAGGRCGAGCRGHDGRDDRCTRRGPAGNRRPVRHRTAGRRAPHPRVPQCRLRTGVPECPQTGAGDAGAYTRLPCRHGCRHRALVVAVRRRHRHAGLARVRRYRRATAQPHRRVARGPPRLGGNRLALLPRR